MAKLFIHLTGKRALVMGIADVALSRPMGALDAATEAIVLFVVGGLALFFGYLARRDWKERPFASGILLVVTALVAWSILGLGANVIALVGAIFVFLAGVLFLVEPVKSGISTVTTAPQA